MDLTSFIDGLAAITPTNADTYTAADGLLHCTQCNGPRQARLDLPGTVMVVPCICNCMEAAMERDAENRKKHEQAMHLQQYCDAGFPDHEYADCTFDVDDGATPEITQPLKAYVEHFSEFQSLGKGLLLYGAVGTGKSFFAACTVNALTSKNYHCLLTNITRLVNYIDDDWSGRQERLDSLCKYDLVAIDDLGAERDTTYINEQITSIVDGLYRAQIPLIITSNLSPTQFTSGDEIRKQRIYDRLTERCLPIQVTGPSRRKEIGRSDFQEMRKLLGL